MSRLVVLDTGPLGLITSPQQTPEVQLCAKWLRALLASGTRIIIPEIADYELRRELLRAGKRNGLKRLDAAVQSLEYLPLTTDAMRQAAALWAQVRQQGLPTADPHALDGDMILAAQALLATESNDTLIVATTNVQHLVRVVPAQLWNTILP
jgi:predicted nucleic acid-binding protein